MELKIITYNIRVQSADSFSKRCKAVAEMIKTNRADVICFQELTDCMQRLLLPLLPEYIFMGGFREANRHGEGTPVAFKREKFYASDCRTSWLSPTPLVPESSYGGDQSDCPRVYTALTLTPYIGGDSFRIYNAHFDHEGKEARLLETEQLLSDIIADNAYSSYPVILTGDLNSAPGVPSIDMIRRAGWLCDATADIKKSFTNYGRPFHPWQGDKIDYIFISRELECVDCCALDGDEFGTCGSDHYAICAKLEL